MAKEEIRAFYLELQGYLSQTPLPDTNKSIYDRSSWEQYNETIDLLEATTGNDYGRFKIMPSTSAMGARAYVDTTAYRQKLNGLINRLHTEYFTKEQSPFSGAPSQIITQTQQQSQATHIQMLLDMQSKIDEKMPNYGEKTKEHKFMERIRQSLSSISSITELLSQVLRTAKKFGLSIDDILKIFT